MAETKYAGVGKRKTSVARVYLTVGTGKITINDRELEDYFPRDVAKMAVHQPFEVTGTTGKFDAAINVCGGGLTGQAGACRHGIARALLKYGIEMRKPLKTAGFLTRDAREVERKKYGRRKARRRFQFSKR